jgi:hypothetical protein
VDLSQMKEDERRETIKEARILEAFIKLKREGFV